MFRICWAKYIIDKKVNGYYLWERTAPFVYTERLSGVNSLVEFFVRDDLTDVAEHILTKGQAESIYKMDYKSSYKSHIKRTIDCTKSEQMPFDYGSFDNFMTEFAKVQLEEGWFRKTEYPESFFTERDKTGVHVGLIKFDGVYMIMKTLSDYIKFEEFIKERVLEVDDQQMKINKWS